MILLANKNKTSKVNKAQKESVITNAETFLSASFNTYWLMIRNHFRSSSFYLGNVLIPFIVTVAAGIYFPITFGFVWMVFLSMTFAGLSTYGTLFFTIRKSTMVKNIQMTANESGTLYFATFWVIFTSLFVTLIFVLATIFILEETGLIGNAFFYNKMDLESPWLTPSDWINYWVIDFKEVWWSMIFYYWIIQTFVCFSMAFFIEKVVSTQKNFFIIVLIYIIGGLVFAGLFTNSLDVEDGQIIAFRTDVEGEATEGRAYALLWGQPLWWVSQLWPHYSMNQMVANSMFVGAHHYVPEGSQFSDIINNIDYDSLDPEIWPMFKDAEYLNQWSSVNMIDSIKSPEAIYYMVMPWVWCVLMIFVAGMLERHDR